MESWMRNLPATSKAIDAEVLAQYRRCASDRDVERWLSQELTQLANITLETANSAQREAWLKRVFANLRLHHLAQVGETEIMLQSYASPGSSQAAQIEALDILTEHGDWARLCALGQGTYEAMLHRLRALAMMGSTFSTSSDEYVKRFCTEYARFSEPQAEVNAERNWLPLLLSLRTALKASPLASPLVGKAVIPSAQAEQHVVALPQQALRRPLFSSGRDRIVSFGAVLGLLIVCGAVLWGGPVWQEIGHPSTGEPGHEPSAAVSLPARSTPTPKSTPKPPIAVSPTPVATPTATPTPTPKPVATPTPIAAPTERAGFFVIGLASREEARAQSEAQKHRAEGLQPRVIYSSRWSGLTPNYYQVVYGIFADRADTVALRKDLERRGIKTYVMHSGQRK